MKKTIFVYGSLKKGFFNEHFLNDFKCVSKKATTLDKYELYPSADYFFPYLFEEENGESSKTISGELYEIDEKFVVDTLDVLEGVDKNFYRREKRVVSVGEKKIEAELYVANDNLMYSDMVDMLPSSLESWSLENEMCAFSAEQYIKSNSQR